VASDYRDFHYALDPVFLKSTLANVSMGVGLFGLVVLLLLTLACAWLLRRAPFDKAVVLPGLLLLAGLFAALVLQPGGVASDWSRQNSVANQLRIAWQQRQPDTPVGDSALASREWLLEPLASATGGQGKPPRNVLLIVLEGLPGAYLPSVGEPLSVSTPVQLPRRHAWDTERRMGVAVCESHPPDPARFIRDSRRRLPAPDWWHAQTSPTVTTPGQR